jgi:hypothetical protein
MPRAAQFPDALSQVWKVLARNPRFTGRGPGLEQLARALPPGAVTVHSAHGMGGIGKTQLATEYAYAHAAKARLRDMVSKAIAGLDALASWFWPYPFDRRRRHDDVSDSGSRMGAVGRCQLRSETVTVPGRTSLTCGNVGQQRPRRMARSVRIEGVRGSNPLSSTEFLQVKWPVRVSGSSLGSQCGSQVV